jgi:hypothetical protein
MDVPERPSPVDPGFMSLGPIPVENPETSDGPEETDPLTDTTEEA